MSVPKFLYCVQLIDKIKGREHLLYFLQINFMEVQLIFNIVLVSAIQQNDSVIHIYTYFFHMIFHYGLSEDIECSSLCYTVGHCCLSVLYIIVYICWSQTPNPSLPTTPPLGNQKSVLCVYESLSVLYIGSFVSYLDSKYKWYHMVFVFLTYFIWASLGP